MGGAYKCKNSHCIGCNIGISHLVYDELFLIIFRQLLVSHWTPSVSFSVPKRIIFLCSHVENNLWAKLL